MAKENATSYTALISQMRAILPRVDEIYRESWAKVTVERLAETLRWRTGHAYSEQMDHDLGDQYRREAARLSKLASRQERIYGGTGGEGFSRYTAYLLASCYLTAEALCFEHPYLIDFIQQELLGQKQILRDINGMLREYDLQDVGCRV